MNFSDIIPFATEQPVLAAFLALMAVFGGISTLMQTPKMLGSLAGLLIKGVARGGVSFWRAARGNTDQAVPGSRAEWDRYKPKVNERWRLKTSRPGEEEVDAKMHNIRVIGLRAQDRELGVAVEFEDTLERGFLTLYEFRKRAAQGDRLI